MDETRAAERDQADVPAAGSSVVLQPRGEGESRTGTVRSWTPSPSGLVMTCVVAIDAVTATRLRGERLWLSATTAAGSLLVFEGVGQQAGAPDQLGVTGMASVARESRRSAVRVEAERPAYLRLSDERVIAARTVDLSRLGARIALPAGLTVRAQTSLTVSVDIDEGDSVTVSGTVLRADDERGQVVVQFTRVEKADRDRLEDGVLARVQALGRR